MIELGDYARDGPLGGFLSGDMFQAENGVEGVALAYDERLVRITSGLVAERVRQVGPQIAANSLEFSSLVASRLARTLRRDEDRDGFDDLDFHLFGGRGLTELWKRVSGRREPFVIHVTVREDADLRGVAAGARESGLPLAFRRSRGAELQAAAAGGRLSPDARPAAFGTIGGFLHDPLAGGTFAVSAEHVCGQGHGLGTPTVLAGSAGPVRVLARGMVRALGHLAPPSLRAERCLTIRTDPPLPAAPHMCMAAVPGYDGLDVALLRVTPSRYRRPVVVAAGNQLSQVLPLTFCGARSGRRRVRISSYSLWHNYRVDGVGDVCVKDCLQIALRARPYVRTDVSAGGDSGSWIMAESLVGPAWVGMLTGGDGDRAGVVPSDRIRDHFNDQASTVFVPQV